MAIWQYVLLTGVVMGVVAWGLERLIARERRLCELPPTSRYWRRTRPMIVTAVSMVAAGLVLWAEWRWGLMNVPEVQPSAWGLHWRGLYHVTLTCLLIVGTTIDLDCSLLPDEITVPGWLLGVIAAVSVQELQIAHLWVDWLYEIPGIRGPYIPEWYDQHRFLHALAWSLTGSLVGAGVTQGVRWISGRLLQQEALGFGDVTFMAMIGSFLGWQAVLMTFVLAPLTGLLFAMLIRVISNRREMPYGPCLAAAAFLVLLNWSRLWRAWRMFFSDLVAVGFVTLAAGGLLVFLLWLLQRRRVVAR